MAWVEISGMGHWTYIGDGLRRLGEQGVIDASRHRALSDGLRSDPHTIARGTHATCTHCDFVRARCRGIEQLMNRARDFWQRIETIHAVTYFAPESAAAAKDAGLKGFWMGYFGFRAAPLGEVSPGTVEATFANFAPSMVRRAVPDVWDFASPEQLLCRRAESAAAALRRLAEAVNVVVANGADGTRVTPENVAANVNGELRALTATGVVLGRPLYAANRDVAAFDDPVQELWQLCSALREQRGDSHVLALATHGVSGIDAHHLLAADSGVDPQMFFASRGWTDAERDASFQGLVERAHLTASGRITESGRALRVAVEGLTDDLALVADPWVTEHLDALARVVVRSGLMPFPNPIGLPAIAT